MNIQTNADITKYSSYRFVSTASELIELHNLDDLSLAYEHITSQRSAYIILGGGSNIVLPPYYHGYVLINKIKGIEWENDTSVSVYAGESLGNLTKAALKQGIDMAYFLGLPGTLGGAVYGNAGVPGQEMGDYVTQIEYFDFDTGNFGTLTNADMQFSYRSTKLKQEAKRNICIIRVCLSFAKSELTKEQIQAKASEWNKERIAKQPQGKSCGSVFKNPIVNGHKQSAGKLIENAGYKGVCRGGVCVSKLHANFWMHEGKNDASGFYELLDEVQNVVYTQTGIWMQPEVEIVLSNG